MFNKSLSVLLSLLIVFSFVCALPAETAAEDAEISSAGVSSGTTGSCTWTLNGTELTVSGNGAMADYEESSGGSPWRRDITKVTISYGVTNIGKMAFFECSELKSVSIAESVRTIGGSAFYGCESLTSITIPDSVTGIDSYSFSQCRNLTDITVGDSVVSIGDYAFQDTPWYENQPEGIIYAGKVAYRIKGDCPTDLEIKQGTISIADGAFYYRTVMKSVTIPDSVTIIGNNAFYGCFGLTSIDIPGSVTTIGISAFSYCTGLTDVKIPDSVTSIGNSAFFGCKELASITIPDSVTAVGSSAFYDTAWYNAQPDGLVYAGKVAYKMKGSCPANVELKDETLGIAGSAFEGRYNLMSITIPDSVVTIGDCAFFGCNALTRVIIPESVISIGKYAFCGCTGIMSITVPASVTDIDDYALGYSYSSEKIQGYTIFGKPGSEAETYARANGFTFKPIPGDVNCDGKVTNFDYGKVNQHVCKIRFLTEEMQLIADINGDGKVTNFDAGKINQHVCKVKMLW